MRSEPYQHAEQCGEEHGGCPGTDQQLAPIDDVSERPRRQREDEHGKRGGDLDQRDDERVRMRWVINQAAAAFCIDVPMFETTVATQSTVNFACRRYSAKIRPRTTAAARCQAKDHPSTCVLPPAAFQLTDRRSSELQARTQYFAFSKPAAQVGRKSGLSILL